MSSVFAVVVFFGCLVEGPAQRSAGSLREAIQTELQEGASVRDVMDFLDRHEIKELSYDDSTGLVRAMKRGIWAGFPTEAAVQLQFYFDQDQRLERSEVEIIFTGL